MQDSLGYGEEEPDGVEDALMCRLMPTACRSLLCGLSGVMGSAYHVLHRWCTMCISEESCHTKGLPARVDLANAALPHTLEVLR